MEFRGVAILLSLLTTFSLLPLSESQQVNAPGRWKMVARSIGISAMHMQLLPNDKVIAYDRTDAGHSNISLPAGKCLGLADCTAHAVEFDPATHRVRPLTLRTETFCSSGSLSGNGTLVQIGGNGTGDFAVRYFSPCDDCDWIEDPAGLAERRWYASSHFLPDGRVIVVGGRRKFSYEFVPNPAKTTYKLQLLFDTNDYKWENNLYPFLHLSTDGNLFIFANTKSILFDYFNHRVLRSFPELTPGIARSYPSTGSSVLLPLYPTREGAGNVKAEVFICGGAASTSYMNARMKRFLPASASCGRMVITDPSPSWEITEMPLRRVMGDMVMLPTGDVLVINGAASGTAGWERGRDPVLAPVLYRTGEKVFETMRASTTERMYHSTALLIGDGRVLVTGSNAHVRYTWGGLFPTRLSMEAFYPPYLGARRPNITSVAPGVELRYGDGFEVGFTMRGLDPRAELKVTMVAPAFNTHSLSMNQRLLVLETEGLVRVRGSLYKLVAFAPASVVLAPPGYYLVFVVHGGVPSKGMWVRIGV